MHPLTRTETTLAGALLAALALACWGPFVAQQAHYHAFADQRAWLGLPCAADVLSNLPFALVGLLGLQRLVAQRAPWGDARVQLVALFFAGLVVTAVCSGYYHWQPDNAGLAVDRSGMVLAFAGLLGAAVADRVSVRMGWVSGHSLKHVAAAMAAWPVLGVMHNVPQNKRGVALAPAV